MLETNEREYPIIVGFSLFLAFNFFLSMLQPNKFDGVCDMHYPMLENVLHNCLFTRHLTINEMSHNFHSFQFTKSFPNFRINCRLDYQCFEILSIHSVSHKVS